MSNAMTSELWKCECNYKCKHSNEGWDMVTKRTFYNHQRQDSLGLVHREVSKRQRHSTDACQTEAVLGTRACSNPCLEEQSIPREGRNNKPRGYQSEERNVWCTCNMYCQGGRRVHISTFYRHQDLMTKYEGLKLDFGLQYQSTNSAINEEPQENHVSEDEVREDDSSSNPIHLFDEANLDVETNDGEVNMFQEVQQENVNDCPNLEDNLDVEIDDGEGNMFQEDQLENDNDCHNPQDNSSVFSKLIERLIELQSLWDEHKLSVGVQDKMLRILFGDLGGSRVSVDSSKRSIASLLVQLPSTWQGDLNGVHVPACWDQMQSMLKGLGMAHAHRYRICTGFAGAKHPPELLYPSNEDNYVGDIPKCVCPVGSSAKKLKRDCSVCCEKCKVCNSTRKEMLSFDYIPIGPQLRLLLKSKTYCHELLRLWRNKNRWLDHDALDVTTNVIDFWDGSKFQDVKEFWNPKAFYELPVVCTTPSCRKLYTTFPESKRSMVLVDGWNAVTQEYSLVCSECKEEFTSKKTICKGDPRNVALLLHWDGFQTSRTTQKSCGVVEIMLLNAGKYSSIDVLPVLFIPWSCKKIMRNSGDVFGAFLKPLIDELETLYLEGVDVHYEYPPDRIFEGPCTESRACKIRAMIMMVTGDHPAQCKIGLFKNGGEEFCRRDKAQATLVRDRYVYDANRQQARYKPRKRTLQEATQALEEAKRSCTQAEREDVWKKAGLSGESILWRLYNLYGFDPQLDLVYDAMHTLALNLFKKYISNLFRDSSTSLKKQIDDAVLVVTKVVPTSIRHGRWPKSPSLYFEMFKAEENQKLIQWCLPYILRVVNDIPPELHVLGSLLIDIAHSFYNFSRDHGWSKENIHTVRTLLQSWRVRNEESLGANSSPLEHVAGNGELLDDVLRHGLHDRYWCYMFERLVKAYSSIKSNNINNEASFVQFYLRTIFTRVFQRVQGDKDALLPFERLLRDLHNSLILPAGFSLEGHSSHVCLPCHANGLLVVSSVGKARDLWSNLLKYGESTPCVDNMIRKGIVISKKRSTYREPTIDEARYIKHFWNIEDESHDIGEIRTYQKVFFKGEVFNIGDNVVVKVDNNEDLIESRGHWKAHITSFFSLQHNGIQMLFFGAAYYKQCIVGDEHSEKLLIDTITGMGVIEKIPLPCNWDCIRPIYSLLHKFFPLSLPRSQKVIAYEVKDLKQRNDLLKEGCVGNVPLWLEVHDIVKVCIVAEGIKNFEYAVVREIHTLNNEAKLAILKHDVSHQNIWKVKKEEDLWRDWDSCVLLIKGWKVIKRKRIIQPGQIDRWIPIVWSS